MLRAVLVRGAAVGVVLGLLVTAETARVTPELHSAGPAALLAGPLVLFHAAVALAIALALAALRSAGRRVGVDLSGVLGAGFLWSAALLAVAFVAWNVASGNVEALEPLKQTGRVALALLGGLAVIRALRRPAAGSRATFVERALVAGLLPAAILSAIYFSRAPAVSASDPGSVDVVALAPRFAPEPASLLEPVRTSPRTRVLVVGLDGASWDRIDRGIAAGRLPSFRRLVEGGVRAPLQTLLPTSSPPIWTTMVTGVSPDIHGVTDFHLLQLPRLGVENFNIHRDFSAARDFLEALGELRPVPVTSSLRRHKAIWNLADEAGLRSAILGLWATWPPEPLEHGLVVSDHASLARRYEWLSRHRAEEVEENTMTWPKELAARLEPFQRSPATVTREELARFLPVDDALWGEFQALPTFSKEKPLSAFRSTHLNDEFFLRAALHLWREERLDFLMVYARAIDENAHFFYETGVPEASALGFSEEEIRRYGEVVDRTYEWTDAELAPFLAAADRDGDTLLVVVSDHGWEKEPDGGYNHNHAPPGILILYGAGLCREGCEPLDRPTVYDVAATLFERLGLPLSQQMIGRPLAEAFAAPRVPTRVASYGAALGGGGAVASEIDSELVEKLRALGYVR